MSRIPRFAGYVSRLLFLLKKRYTCFQKLSCNNIFNQKKFKFLFLTIALCCCYSLILMMWFEFGLGFGVGVFLTILIVVLYYYWRRYRGRTGTGQRTSDCEDLSSSEFPKYGRTTTSTHNETGNRASHQKRKHIENQNLAFYRNEIPFRPNGDYIDNILNIWAGNYALLEKNHDYIQWLFPNRMPGVNSDAAILNDEEAQIIRDTPELKIKVKKAFEMMLDFYGMMLTKDNEFELAHNHPKRLEKLNQWGNHNFLRISSILLALKEFGYKEFMLPWMLFLADLIYEKDILNEARNSFENYWIKTLDAEDQDQLQDYLPD